MTHYEAMEIYMDLSVHLQYKDLEDKTNIAVATEWVHKHGEYKIYEAVKVLCAHLDEERKTYLRTLQVVNIVKRMEDKNG